MALVKLKSPAEMGADCAVGTTQRFGIPLGYGGPHAAFFACKKIIKEIFRKNYRGFSGYVRKTCFKNGFTDERTAHQERRATSNICTAQVLLAVMAGMYAVYHGPKGLNYIADQIHFKANALKGG
jgi:glycine dehydrogenase